MSVVVCPCGCTYTRTRPACPYCEDTPTEAIVAAIRRVIRADRDEAE